jgi:hypothetical protein
MNVHTTTSWKGEVIADDTGTWTSNAMRFATDAEAKQYVYDLAMRWLAVREWRTMPSPDPVNYAIIDGKLHRVATMDEVAP